MKFRIKENAELVSGACVFRHVGIVCDTMVWEFHDAWIFVDDSLASQLHNIVELYAQH